MTLQHVLEEIAISMSGEYREWDTGILSPLQGTKEERAVQASGQRDFLFQCPGLQLRKVIPLHPADTVEQDSDIIRAQIIVRLSNAGAAWMQYHDSRIKSRFENW